MRRALYVALAVAFLGAWAFAIGYSLAHRNDAAIDDAARHEIERVCDDVAHQLPALAPLPEDPGVDDRVARIDAENSVFTGMVAELEPVEPSRDDAVRPYGEWLGDWRAMISAREDYARDLASDADAQFTIPVAKAGNLRPVTDRIDDYATIQGLDACAPGRLGVEVVEGERVYEDGEGS